jgi:hypothetical protein
MCRRFAAQGTLGRSSAKDTDNNFAAHHIRYRSSAEGAIDD